MNVVSDIVYRTPSDVQPDPTVDEIKFWEMVYIGFRTAGVYIHHADNHAHALKSADQAIHDRRERFGVR